MADIMTFAATDIACPRGGTLILDGVTFTAPPGTALVLRGPNGAGKTTLLRCIAGLTPPVAGTFSFTPDDVAYAAHADGLKSQMTGAETLAFWSAIYGTDHINTAIQAYDLQILLDRPIQDMSAGQKRRLSLSRLILTGRKLWALDEPTVSLDTENVARFAAAIRAHLDAGGAAIIATHIDLGLTEARDLHIAPFAAIHRTQDLFDEAFL